LIISNRVKKRYSYADCFAAVLAKLCNTVMNHQDEEFRQIEDEAKMLWD